MDEPVEEGPSFGRIGDPRLDGLEADAVHPFVDALQVEALLAIGLDGRGDDLHRLVLARRPGQDLGPADVQARRAADVDLVAAADADHADVLAGRLGAVARAAGDARA